MGYFEASRRSQAEGEDRESVVVVAVVYHNERLREGVGWSQHHLGDDVTDWPEFSDISGKHKVGSSLV
jgi:hypothetical protein